MNWLLRIVALVGIADSLWLTVDPKGWGRFWQRGVGQISKQRKIANAVAALEFAICLKLLGLNGRK